jgi:cysteine desulfurase
MKPIYLDNNASTPIHPEIKKAISNSLSNQYNPSSAHKGGREKKACLIKARLSIANICGCSSSDIIFTSSGTESINILVESAVEDNRLGHIICANTDHKAVLESVKKTKRYGWDYTIIQTGPDGYLSKQLLEKNITKHTKIVITSSANNETGIITDIDALSEICKRHGILLFVDNVCATGKTKLTNLKLVDGFASSGHKFYAPSGIGFMYLKNAKKHKPFITGGSQELGLRAGTENYIGIIAMADAFSRVHENLDNNITFLRTLRDRFENILRQHLNISINGHHKRLPNTSNIYFHDIDAEELFMKLDENNIFTSLGSACASGSVQLSHVLLGMGYSRERCQNSMRFSFGIFNTMEEVKSASQKIITIVQSKK